jgi:hypothetical protein
MDPKGTPEGKPSMRVLGWAGLVLGSAVEVWALFELWRGRSDSILPDPVYFTLLALGIAMMFGGYRLLHGRWPGPN